MKLEGEMKMLNGKVAIITGSGSGLGKAAALLFAENGCKVVVADYNVMAAKEVAEEIKEHGGDALFIWLDVTDRKSAEDVVKHTKNLFDRIDILINNAGITRDKTLLKMTEEQFDAVINTNLKGVFNMTQAVVPHMLEQGSGRIINTSSVVRNGNVGQTNYSASKAAVVAMTKTWAKEFGRKGINVNAVAPGFMKTPMTEAMPKDVLNIMANMVPLKRLGEPEDIANAYLFLTSEMSNYVNGTVLEVDGGLIV
jgi:3-oxoacyl-[acyl-carrier protein] reductase